MNQDRGEATASAPEAADFLRRHCEGVLNCDGECIVVRYVLGRSGAPVICGRPGILSAESTVLFVPSDVPDVLELLVMLQGEDGESADADRWRIYHGRPYEAAFYRLKIDAAKWRGQVFDGSDMMVPNPLAECEAVLCRSMNLKHRDDLMAMSRVFNNVEIDEAVLVGVDPKGFDIRAKGGIVRINAPHRLLNETEARRTLDRLRRQAAGGAK